MKFSKNYIQNIKLIIWDLDDTFWKGTLSDNMSLISIIDQNILLVKKLSYRGIMNSVCSKNDKETAENMLDRIGIKDYFVFNSINWEPKGLRIKGIITDMALRPNNVLYIDDNPANLAEAENVLPEIMVSDPSIIEYLIHKCDSLGKDDCNLSRLEQYRILEIKRKDETQFNTNEEFLNSSEISISLSDIREESFYRILELIQRTNQLNYTKKRIDEKQLRQLLLDNEYILKSVSVKDKYGEYGIAGFYALNKHDNKLEHFLFSCRIMGMGIEQYIYSMLGFPNISIIGPVSTPLSETNEKPDYISLVDNILQNTNDLTEDTNETKILLKGPCDLEIIASYIESKNVRLDKEFNFIDEKGNQADYYNHTVNILNNDKKVIDKWLKCYSFLNYKGFETRLFCGEYDVVCLSPLMDATLAVFEDFDGNRIAYGLYTKPLIDSNYHKDYLEKSIMTARSEFFIDELEEFSNEFREVNYGGEDVADNLDIIVKRIIKSNSRTKIVIILLSELQYISKDNRNQDTFKNKHIIHKCINKNIKKRFENNGNVHLLDVNKFIRSQSDYFDNINHYSKYVYYKIAQELVTYINIECGSTMVTSSKIKMYYQNVKRFLYKSVVLRWL